MVTTPRDGAPPDWYKDAVIYELHVRAFFDGNNDGKGDFLGLIQKLDYLQDLGVTCLWILPHFPSPLRDDGYDIADYYGVHPHYGNLQDFATFVKEAHCRDIRVLVELVMNHTSDQHPWFQEARRAKDSPKRDYYVWSDTWNKYTDARIIFLDTEKSNWAWDEASGQYYWHRFYSSQPDLNFDNPAVREEMIKALGYWLEMGVDGFRVDAVPYLFEREGTSCENLPETHGYVKEVRRRLDAQFPGRVLLAEANQWPEDVIQYFGQGDEFHMAFHFPIMPRLFMALKREDRTPIVEILARTPAIPASCQWAMFLRNHDELTLEMVTDDERDYMYNAYAADPDFRLNLGIRRRLAPLLDNDRRKIELLHSVLLTMHGTPVLYYGDEIGMGDNVWLGDRNGVRTPMQWSVDRNAGFSKADPGRLYFPVIADPVYGYMAVNVEAQQRSPYSLYHAIRRMIAVRKQHPLFGRGDLTMLAPENRAIVAYMRALGNDRVLLVHNFSAQAQAVDLDLASFDGSCPTELLTGTSFPACEERPYRLTLPPYGFFWFGLRQPT